MYSYLKSLNSLYLIVFILFSLIFGVTGCGGGDTPGTASDIGSENGEIVISLTDAKGDFATYTVDVLSLNLTRANGAEVSVLPVSTRIDFAQYTEMTEFLTAATVPSGTYVSATMTLGYQDADIWVENDSGTNVKVTNIVDENGDPVTTLEVSVQLEDRNRLTIGPGIPVHLMLDFDLQASNHVEFEPALEPILTVEPFLVADVDFTHRDKRHRIRGLLDEVNLDENSFSVILRPFYCSLTDTHRFFGTRSVITTDETLFNINNVAYTGNEGLTSMDELDSLTPVVAIGELKFDPLRFEATEVYAGSSVPGANLDVISGWVTERSGDSLTVKGASLIRKGNRFSFNDHVTLLVGDETVVTRELSGETYNKDDISIGQHINAFGNLTLAGDDNEYIQIDASSGYVRMTLTTIRGTVVSVDPNDTVAQLDINLQSIGKYRAGIFDFTGTGTSPEYDAAPENYEIFTGTMYLGDIYNYASVKLKGFVEPFGTAPADFYSYTLIDVTALRSFMKIDWDPATPEPFTEILPDSLTLNLDGVDRLHYLTRGHVVIDLLDLQTAPVMVHDEDGEGFYVLYYGGTTEIHTVYEDYTEAVKELIEEGYLARKCYSMGQFDDATSTLTAESITIWFRRTE